MFYIALIIMSAGIILMAIAGQEDRPPGTIFMGGICIIISILMMYGAGVYSNDAKKGIEYTFVAKVDEEVIVYQNYDPVINPRNKRVVRIVAGEDFQPDIQPGDTVVLTDNGIKKVLLKEKKSSTR